MIGWPKFMDNRARKQAPVRPGMRFINGLMAQTESFAIALWPRKTKALLSYGIAQAFAITIIIFVAYRRAGLRQPLIAHYGIERAALAVDRPNTETNRGETTEPAATTAAGMSQPRTPRR